MANTKNFALRLQVIDPMLRRPGGVTLKELMEACNRRFRELGYTEGDMLTAVNTLRGDLYTIEQTYSTVIDKQRRGKPEYFWYHDPNFSVFKVALSAEELLGLEKVLGMLGRLQGLPEFEWAAEMGTHLKASFYHAAGDDRPMITFDSDPQYKGTRWLEKLYDCIVRRKVLLVKYREFDREEEVLVFHPWHLRQYRHRWYVFGKCNRREGVTRLALDRIEHLSTTATEYIPNTEIDFNHFFDDIIGVAHHDNGGPQEVVFRVPRYQAPWMDTEPLHKSQQRMDEDACTVTYRMQVAVNHELLQILLGYSAYVEVLAPQPLREFMASVHASALDKYGGCFDWEEEQRAAEEER